MERYAGILLCNPSRPNPEQLALDLIKGLWQDNNTIVNEFKTLAESHTSSIQTNIAMGNKLKELEENQRVAVEALKEINTLNKNFRLMHVK